MTAIIGILNKSAVGIAADSAVTVGSGDNHKVYNHANKIFNLSIGNPIGIMIYNSAEFSGIPWETIIKQYRNYSGNKTFDFTYQYRDDFIKYLKTYGRKFGKADEEDTIVTFVSEYLNSIEADLGGLIEERFPDEQDWISQTPESRTKIYFEEINKLLKVSKDVAKNFKTMTTLRGVTASSFKKKNKKFIDTVVNERLAVYNLSKNKTLLKDILDIVSVLITKEVFFSTYTGLVFTGFGEKEIYPSLYSINVGGVVGKQFRYSILKEATAIIDNKNEATICPFAQTDIMQTFVEGIDPSLRDSIPIAFDAALSQFKDFILNSVDNSNPTERKLKKLLEKFIPQVVTALTERLEELRYYSHIFPMLRTISSLSKQDIAELAESLISLTYLKRRASFSAESVGGPVDVAVITKGDGFIWIKRKNYFRPELNINYISKANSQTYKL